ncbi:MAG: hypothetical protein ACK5MZ_03930 [Aestuariibaculum sp.]
MIYLRFIVTFISISAVSQTLMETDLIEKTPFEANDLIKINSFGGIFYTQNDVLLKKDEYQKNILNYSNFQLGKITSANAFNPLKINIFYQDFNTVVILDNRLAEIFKIDFNNLEHYKNITHISTGYDNTIWIFNQNTQQLELFDYKTLKSKNTTLPIKSEVLDIESNYNYCWLLTKEHLYMYNYFGRLIKSFKNDNFTQLAINNENAILKRENALFYLNGKTGNIIPIKLPNLSINSFFTTNESLYIYGSKTIYKLNIKTN